MRVDCGGDRVRLVDMLSITMFHKKFEMLKGVKLQNRGRWSFEPFIRVLDQPKQSDVSSIRFRSRHFLQQRAVFALLLQRFSDGGVLFPFHLAESAKI